MRTMRRGVVLAGMMAVMLAGPVSANSNPNGISFRAVGWYQGLTSASSGTVTCTVPTLTTGVVDGAFSLGLWNTYGAQTLFFPDTSNPLANPCGGWMQLSNNMIDQAIILDHVQLRYTIPGARRYRLYVPVRNHFPVQCRQLRRATIYVGATLLPVNSSQDPGFSGAVNVAFVQLLPLVATDVIHCLREQYAPLPSSVLVSIPLRIRATAVGVTDTGDTLRANTLNYNLTLRHTCGNGRIDDGESCDPNAPNSCVGACPTGGGTCSQDTNLACTTNADCVGSCVPVGDPEECNCVY
jgi:hypothetical protein